MVQVVAQLACHGASSDSLYLRSAKLAAALTPKGGTLNASSQFAAALLLWCLSALRQCQEQRSRQACGAGSGAEETEAPAG